MAHTRKDGRQCQGRFYQDPQTMQVRCNACRESVPVGGSARPPRTIEASPESVNQLLHKRAHPEEQEKENPYREGIVAGMDTVQDQINRAKEIQVKSNMPPQPSVGLRTPEAESAAAGVATATDDGLSPQSAVAAAIENAKLAAAERAKEAGEPVTPAMPPPMPTAAPVPVPAASVPTEALAMPAGPSMLDLIASAEVEGAKAKQQTSGKRR
ncbi:MAG: hypothetical protein Q7R41_18625 [Phycisphaerales bacterium]|nr:hypothetical protein [Phycisphaerales bacterium]